MPNTLPALNGQWQADSIAQADGTTVATWGDGSGNGHTLTPVATGPTYKTGIVNGKPVVRFAASGTTLTTAWANSTPPAMSISIVAKFSTVTGPPQFFVGATPSYPYGWSVGAGDYHLGTWGLYAGDAAQVSSPSAPDTAWHVWTATFDGASTARIYLDGALIATNAAVTGLANDGTVPAFIVGGYGTDYFSGDVAFVGRATRLLSTADRAQLHSWAQDTYGLSVTDYAASGAGAVTAVRAQATVTAPIPTVDGQVAVSGGGPAVVTAAARVPSVSAAASAAVLAVRATATGTALAPTALGVIGAKDISVTIGPSRLTGKLITPNATRTDPTIGNSTIGIAVGPSRIDRSP